MHQHHHHRRRKKRHTHGLRKVEVTRGRNGYGFTISGQHPCVLSCIVSGSPADKVGLKTGDFLMAVNDQNVSAASHDDVVRLIGSSRGLLVLQIAENFNSSDSSEDEFPTRPKSKYPNRRPRQPQVRVPENHVRPEYGVHQRNNNQAPNLRYRAASIRNIPRSDNHIKQLNYVPDQRNQRRSNYADHDNGADVEALSKRQKHFNNGGGIVTYRSPHHTKHTIITREHRLGISKSRSDPEGFKRPREPETVQSDPNFLHAPAYPHLQNGNGICQPGIGECELDYAQDCIRAVVGYVGSIEMPPDARLLNSIFQSIRSAVRRLQIEKRIHTLVMMDIAPDGVRLINSMRSVVAHYTCDRVAFGGLCPDDHRFFGIVTLHEHSSEEIHLNTRDDKRFSGGSCHVFMVEPELSQHSLHAVKARNFGIQCTINPDTQQCFEFPNSAALILKCLSRFYRDKENGTHHSEFAHAMAFAGSNLPQQPLESNSSSNSDSGLGFWREGLPVSDPVYVIDMPPNDSIHSEQSGQWTSETSTFITPNDCSGNISTLEQDLSMPPSERFSGSGISENSPHSMMNTSNSSHESSLFNQTLGDSTLDKLNVRAMPDPLGYSAATSEILDSQTSATSLRKGVHRILQTRQHQLETCSSQAAEQRPDVTEDGFSRNNYGSMPPPPLLPRRSVLSRSYNRSSASSISSGGHDRDGERNVVSPDSKLSPRAVLPPAPAFGAMKTLNESLPVAIPTVPSNSTIRPPIPERRPSRNNLLATPPPIPDRPKSTPPTKSSRIAPVPETDYDSDPGKENESFMSLVKEKWNNVISNKKSPVENRRFSEGFNFFGQRQSGKGENNKASKRLRKGGSFKQLPTKTIPLSNSHESLVVSEQSDNVSRAGGSPGILKIGGKSQEQENDADPLGGRSASWALSFERLLTDRAGLGTFTEFLKKEFSEENIIFWTKCAVYREMTDIEERKTKARDIFLAHVADNATDPVNVDCRARQVTHSGLERAHSTLFDIAQQQIFQLMKQDSYPRFLKSDLYKDCVVTEMEGRPLPYDNKLVEIKEKREEKRIKKTKSSSSADEGGEERRRRSLLPWSRIKGEKKLSKMNTDPDLRKGNDNKEKSTNNAASKGSMDLADLSMLSREVRTAIEEGCLDVGTQAGVMRENHKFCRVILPDNSTTVIYAKTGQSVKLALQRLCERRNLILGHLEVLLVGSDKPLDMLRDVSTLGSKEIKLESRIVFRLDISTKKSVVMRSKAGRTFSDVLQPVLLKFGLKMDNLIISVFQTGVCLNLESDINIAHKKRIVAQSLEEFVEWGGFAFHGRNTGKPPLPRSKSESSKTGTAKENLEKLFRHILEGQVEADYDDIGIWDPDKKEDKHKNEESRGSGFLGFIRRNSVSREDLNRMKPNKAKAMLGYQSRPTGQSGKMDTEEENFLDMLSRVQSRQLDDQRGFTPQDFELPDFLKVKSLDLSQSSKDDLHARGSLSNRFKRTDFHNSEPSIFERVAEESVLSVGFAESQENSPLRRENSINERYPLKNLSPVYHKLKHGDNSFTRDGIVPSHNEAEKYFSNRNDHADSPDYNDPGLMEGSLRDIGMADNTGLNTFPRNRLQATEQAPTLPARGKPLLRHLASLENNQSKECGLDNCLSNTNSNNKMKTHDSPQAAFSHLPSPPKHFHEIDLTNVEIANFSPPTPLRTGAGHCNHQRPEIRSESEVQLEFDHDLNSTVHMASSSSTPSPTTHDLILSSSPDTAENSVVKKTLIFETKENETDMHVSFV